ncbi:DUF6048 family protein [Sediminicola luteus]|uniref:Outer membrane protein beta-barrel domain-containing protein n=1 Tax=Sediminicola luteus TaxID=319238 RepID=A0A2A4G3Z5_9FLAO|nr:DUF6048 family protein [Sediminicola luteus]PCE62680.1 hypothetical protein B7P33_17810 [Sediminicola luteus]
MSKSFISLLCLCGMLWVNAQDKVVGDTLPKSERYGLRAGIDLSKIVRSFLNEDYTGLEFVADYRLKEKLYLAGEFGTEEFTQQETLGSEENNTQTTLYEYTTSGTYFKAGVDYNVYDNWYGMSNMIHVGGRVAYSTHSQEVLNYRIYDSNRVWSPDEFVPGTAEIGKHDGLNALWIEAVLGIKAELFANFYLGGSIRLGYLVNDKAADNFPNLWIPGFQKVTDESSFGATYNYSLTYFLPLYKKKKAPKEVEE